MQKEVGRVAEMVAPVVLPINTMSSTRNWVVALALVKRRRRLAVAGMLPNALV